MSSDPEEKMLPRPVRLKFLKEKRDREIGDRSAPKEKAESQKGTEKGGHPEKGGEHTTNKSCDRASADVSKPANKSCDPDHTRASAADNSNKGSANNATGVHLLAGDLKFRDGGGPYVDVEFMRRVKNLSVIPQQHPFWKLWRFLRGEIPGFDYRLEDPTFDGFELKEKVVDTVHAALGEIVEDSAATAYDGNNVKVKHRWLATNWATGLHSIGVLVRIPGKEPVAFVPVWKISDMSEYKNMLRILDKLMFLVPAEYAAARKLVSEFKELVVLATADIPMKPDVHEEYRTVDFEARLDGNPTQVERALLLQAEKPVNHRSRSKSQEPSRRKESPEEFHRSSSSQRRVTKGSSPGRAYHHSPERGRRTTQRRQGSPSHHRSLSSSDRPYTKGSPSLETYHRSRSSRDRPYTKGSSPGRAYHHSPERGLRNDGTRQGSRSPETYRSSRPRRYASQEGLQHRSISKETRLRGESSGGKHGRSHRRSASEERSSTSSDSSAEKPARSRAKEY